MDKNDDTPHTATTANNNNNTTTNDTVSPPPPSYAPIEGIESTAAHHTGAAPLSLAADRDNLPFKPYVDGTSLPILNSNGQEDVEAGTTNKKKRWHKAAHGKLKDRFGGAIALIAVVGTILLVLGAVGGIIFGISVGSERGLTG